MAKKGGTPPAAPNPTVVSNAQTASNVQTGIANSWMQNANESSPYGNVTYAPSSYQQVWDPTNNVVSNVPQFTRTVTLSPAQQGLLDQQNQLQSTFNTDAQNQLNNVNSILSQPVSTAGLPAAVSSFGGVPNTDFSADRAKVVSDIQARLSPELQRQKEALDTQLVNSGLQRGTEGYNRQMDEFNRSSNDANIQADLAGGTEQSRLAGLAAQNFGMRQSAADFQNTARERALQEQLALRDQPLNEISTLMSGGQVTMPQFTPFKAGTIAPTDVSGNYYNSANINAKNYANQQQVAAGAAGGLYGLGGALLGNSQLFKLASDRRLKRDIAPVGSAPRGLTLYSFRYLWDDAPQVGVMADEVERVLPAAVSDVGGIKVVDYGMVWSR